MKKKFISAVLVLLMLFSMIPTVASAGEETPPKQYTTVIDFQSLADSGLFTLTKEKANVVQGEGFFSETVEVDQYTMSAQKDDLQIIATSAERCGLKGVAIGKLDSGQRCMQLTGLNAKLSIMGIGNVTINSVSFEYAKSSDGTYSGFVNMWAYNAHTDADESDPVGGIANSFTALAESSYTPGYSWNKDILTETWDCSVCEYSNTFSIEASQSLQLVNVHKIIVTYEFGSSDQARLSFNLQLPANVGKTTLTNGLATLTTTAEGGIKQVLDGSDLGQDVKISVPSGYHIEKVEIYPAAVKWSNYSGAKQCSAFTSGGLPSMNTSYWDKAKGVKCIRTDHKGNTTEGAGLTIAAANTTVGGILNKRIDVFTPGETECVETINFKSNGTFGYYDAGYFDLDDHLYASRIVVYIAPHVHNWTVTKNANSLEIGCTGLGHVGDDSIQAYLYVNGIDTNNQISYSGQPVEATMNVARVGNVEFDVSVTYEETTDGGENWTTCSAPTLPGKYRANATVSYADDSAALSQEFEIVKLTPTPTDFYITDMGQSIDQPDGNVEYCGENYLAHDSISHSGSGYFSAHTISTLSEELLGGVTYTYYRKNGVVWIETTEIKEVGTYKVEATVTGNEAVNSGVVLITDEIHVNPIELDVEWPDASTQDFTYTGEAIAPEADFSAASKSKILPGETVNVVTTVSNGVSDVNYTNQTIQYTAGTDNAHYAVSKKTASSGTNDYKITKRDVGVTILTDSAIFDGTAKSISFSVWSNAGLSPSADFAVEYYKIDRDEETLSTKKLTAANGIGTYLYVITRKNTGNTAKWDNYDYSAFYSGSPAQTYANLDKIAAKPNAGYFLVKGGDSGTVSQQPIYFDEGIVNVNVGGSVTNALVNPNSSSIVTYESSKPAVASVDSSTGRVTVLKTGTATIKATSVMTGAANVYASYTLNVTKQEVIVTVSNETVAYGDQSPYTGTGKLTFSPAINSQDYNASQLAYTTGYAVGKAVGQYTVRASGLSSDKYNFVYESGTLTVNEKTLSLGDFTVTASAKKYDGTTDAAVSAAVKNTALVGGDKLGVTVTASFAGADVKKGENVSFSITGLTGVKAANYKLATETISGNTTADISAMKLTAHYPTLMTFTYDGTKKVPIVTVEDENGKQFYDFVLKYNGNDTAPENVGTYSVAVAVSSGNYSVVSQAQNMNITKANAVVWASTGTSQLFTGSPCTITPMSAPNLGVKVTYYAVSGDGKVGSSVTDPTSIGKYLYVITLDETAAKNYAIAGEAGAVNVGDPVSTHTAASNCGILIISNNVQPALSFSEDVVNKAFGDASFTNAISGGAEGAEITYSVQNDCVTVDPSTGAVSIVKPGSTVIKAVATKEGFDDTEAHYTVIVSKKDVTISLPENTDQIYMGHYDGVDHLITVPYTISNESVTDLIFTYTQRNDNEKHTPYRVNAYYFTIQVNPENEFYQSNLVSGYMDILQYTLIDGDDRYFDIENTEFTYNAGCQIPTITAGDPNMGELSFRYFLDGTEVKNPTNAGTYTVKVSMTESDDFNAVTDVELNTTFTILPKPISLE